MDRKEQLARLIMDEAGEISYLYSQESISKALKVIEKQIVPKLDALYTKPAPPIPQEPNDLKRITDLEAENARLRKYNTETQALANQQISDAAVQIVTTKYKCEHTKTD